MYMCMYFFRYKIIEDKLNISNYLSWTFCSCMYGTFKDLNYTQFTIDITLISQCLSVYLFISVSASVDVHVRERKCLLLVSDLILACVDCVTFVSVMFSQLYTLLLLSSWLLLFHLHKCSACCLWIFNVRMGYWKLLSVVFLLDIL